MTSRDRLRRHPVSVVRRQLPWVGLAAALAAGFLALVCTLSAAVLLRHHEPLGLEPQLLLPAFLDAGPMLETPQASRVAPGGPVLLQSEKSHDFA